MLRYFKFSYHLPILRIFVYTVAATLFFSVLLTFTPIHINLLKKAEMNELPIIGGMYEAIHDSEQAKGVIRGNVISIQNNTFVLSHDDGDKDADDGTWNVIPPPNFNVSNLYLGEKLYVAGITAGNNFNAFGVHELQNTN
jgi:hypothetical protein